MHLSFSSCVLSVCDATHLSRPLGTGSSFFELFELPLILFFFSGSSPLVVLVILLSIEESMLQKLCCHVLCIYYVDFKRVSYSKISCNFFCSLFVCRVQLPIAGRLERDLVPVGSQHGAHQWNDHRFQGQMFGKWRRILSLRRKVSN